MKRAALCLAWAALVWVTLLASLGGFGLVGPDEPRYAAIAAAMLRRHDFITPWLWGAPWFEKPVLYYWLAAAGDAVGNVGAACARLPNALLAVGMCLGLWAFLRRVHGARAALIFAFLAPTAVFVCAFARSATTDMTLTAPLALSLAALFLWVREQHRRWLLACAAAMALATLAKGPVAVVLAALVLVGFCFWERHWIWWRRALRPLPITIFFALAAPWYVLTQLRNPTFFKVFFLQHNLERFATNRFEHPQPFWYYLPVLLLALFPWTGWLGLPIRDAARRRFRLSGLDAFLWAWTLAPLVFFSISHSKLPGYLLPAIPGALLLIAVSAADNWQRLPRWPLAISALLAGAVPAALQLAPWLLMPRNLRPPLAAMPLIWLWLWFGTAAVLLLLVLRRRWVLVVSATCLLMASGVVALTQGPIRHDINAALSGAPLADQLQRQCATGLPTTCGTLPLFTWHLNRDLLYGAQFGLGAALVELPARPPAPAVVLTDRAAAAALAAQLGPDYRTVVMPEATSSGTVSRRWRAVLLYRSPSDPTTPARRISGTQNSGRDSTVQ